MRAVNDAEKLYFHMLAASGLAEKQRKHETTRYEEHRLLEHISAISQLTGKHGRDIWLDMVEQDFSLTRS